MRLMIRDEAQFADMARQEAEGRDGEGGLETLPNVCFKIENCAAHRCSTHTTVPLLNMECYYDNMVECGACAYERGRREARLWFRLKQWATRAQKWPYGCRTCANYGQILNLKDNPAVPMYLPCPDCDGEDVRSA